MRGTRTAGDIILCVPISRNAAGSLQEIQNHLFLNSVVRHFWFLMINVLAMIFARRLREFFRKDYYMRSAPYKWKSLSSADVATITLTPYQPCSQNAYSKCRKAPTL